MPTQKINFNYGEQSEEAKGLIAKLSSNLYQDTPLVEHIMSSVFVES